ncbi:hypothetical protein FJY63_11885, partial [Candidatus Sumerlaeota bacterium]|nr:hypothetical protein [Candidatus Sumerlaeota bacterium]
MADNSRKKLGYRDLARYLIAHKWRLVIALFSMVMVGFFGSFNFLLIKPALEVILGAERSQQSLTVVHRHEDGTTQTLTLRDDGMSPDRQAGDNIYAGYSGSLAGQQAEREAFEVAVAPEVVSKKKARPGEMIDVGFLRSLKTRWDALLRPVGARVQEWDKRLKEYGRTNQMNALLIIAALLVAMSMCHGFFDFLAQYEMTYSLLDMMRRLKDDLFRSVLSQDYLYLVRQTTGYLESRISSDVGVLRNTVDVLLTDTIQAPVRLVFLLLVLLILNFQLTLVAVIVLPLAAVPLVYFARAMRRVTRRQKRQADQLSSAMEESLRNFQVIKCFQSEQIEIQRFTKVNLKLFKYYMQRRIARFGAPPLMEVLGAMGASAVVMIGGYLILAGRMEFSALMVYLLTLTQFYMP